MSLLPHGQRDYSTVRLSRHALERFIERRLHAEPGVAANLRFAGRSRGNPEGWAVTRRTGQSPCWGFTAIRYWWRSCKRRPA